jgi:hypothetical protein
LESRKLAMTQDFYWARGFPTVFLETLEHSLAKLASR